jgi:transposase-like protein
MPKGVLVQVQSTAPSLHKLPPQTAPGLTAQLNQVELISGFGSAFARKRGMSDPRKRFPRGSCAFNDCRGHFKHPEFSPNSKQLIRKGHFYRASDSRWIQRFKCRLCQRGFSSATRSDCYQQKKRHLNRAIAKLLTSAVSERRTARLLGVKWETVSRKAAWLGFRAKALNQEATRRHIHKLGPIHEVQFDEMESFEHSKCKPLSIPLLIEPKSRAILGLRVASMPAKGPLARIAYRKYGPREDLRSEAARALWGDAKTFLASNPKVTTDQNPRYPAWIRTQFPEAKHTALKGRRGCVVGFGELKSGGFDPLFSLNHTAAMIRANINRLARKTWCTTKLAQKLELRLELYAWSHNQAVGWS